MTAHSNRLQNFTPNSNLLFCITNENYRSSGILSIIWHLRYGIRYELSISISLVLLVFSPFAHLFHAPNVKWKRFDGPETRDFHFVTWKISKIPKFRHVGYWWKEELSNFIKITNLIELCFFSLCFYTINKYMWHFQTTQTCDQHMLIRNWSFK